MTKLNIALLLTNAIASLLNWTMFAVTGNLAALAVAVTCTVCTMYHATR